MAEQAQGLDAIAAAVAAARAGASQVAAQTPAAPANVAVQTPGAPPVVGGRPVTLGELLNQGGMRVDAYLKVDKSGFMIGTDLIADELPLTFCLAEVVPYFAVRYGSSPTKYLKSFDRLVTAQNNKDWSTSVSEAMAADSKCRGDYPTCDIPFTLEADITALKGGKVLLKKGQTLGLTFSITNFKDFAAFIKPFDDLKAIGQIPENLVLKGNLKHEARSGNGNTWGAATFPDFVPAGFKDGGDAAE